MPIHYGSKDLNICTVFFKNFLTFPPIRTFYCPIRKSSISYLSIDAIFQRNGSADYDGDFTMYTGMETLDNIGQIYAWKNSTTIDPSIYPFHCGELTGSAGEFFPPNRDKTFVDYFVPDLCRHVLD